MVIDLSLSDSVIFSGKQLFSAIPSFIANFHIALVSANSSEGFHYSPLKLREYLACGKSCIAPRAGDLPSIFSDCKELLFYEAGNINDLAEKITILFEDNSLHTTLCNNAINLFEREGTWVHELKNVCDRLSINY